MATDNKVKQDDHDTTTSPTTLWSAQIMESKLQNALMPFFEPKVIELIILYHGNLSTKCCNFLQNDMRNRKTEYKSLKPKTFTVNEFTIELWLNCDRFPRKGEGWVAVRNDNQIVGVVQKLFITNNMNFVFDTNKFAK
eukprot:628709_1